MARLGTRRVAMAETTSFMIGADASCTDGACGEVTCVVVNPLTRAVTHLVVEPKLLRAAARLVPLDLIDATTGEMRVGCTLAEFARHDLAEETQFSPGTPGDPGCDPEQVLVMPYSGMGIGMGRG